MDLTGVRARRLVNQKVFPSANGNLLKVRDAAEVESCDGLRILPKVFLDNLGISSFVSEHGEFRDLFVIAVAESCNYLILKQHG